MLVCPLALLPQAARKPARKAAPPPSAEVPKFFPIEAIHIEGNKLYTPEQIIKATKLRLGEPGGKAEFDAARDRLVASGVFEQVGYRFGAGPSQKGYAVTFEVIEVEPVYPVRFSRLPLPDDEMKAWLEQRDPFFGEKIPATRRILDRHVAALQELLSSKGHTSKVIAKVTADRPDDLYIQFRPETGPPVVAQVIFKGNTVLSNTVLLNTFGAVAYGTPYSEGFFRQLLDTSVRPLYEARGRIRVKFSNFVTAPSKQADGLVVTVDIDEGETYNLNKVSIVGELPVKEEDLLTSGKFPVDELANFDEVKAGLERVRKRLRRVGYMNPQLDTERNIDDRKKLVNLTVKVEPGDQFTFGKLNIEGLDIHGEAAIRKMWTMQPGKPFNADYPDYFLNRVREDNIFDGLGKTKSVLAINDQTRIVDVTLQFGASPPPPPDKRKRGSAF